MLRSLLFPRRCVHCGKAESEYLCDDCFESVTFSETQFCPALGCETASFNGNTHESCRQGYDLDGHLSLTVYEGVMQSVFEYYKRRKVTKLENQLERIVEYYFVEPEPPFPFSLLHKQVVVPVPQFWIDERLRGFNPAHTLAKHISNTLQLDFSDSLLKKTKPTLAQKKLSREKRLQNVDGAFGVVGDCSDKEVVIVDDVWTTGSTMRACAHVLKKHGAEHVWAISFARGV